MLLEIQSLKAILYFLGALNAAQKSNFDFCVTHGDRRTQGWMLVDSPVPTLLYTVIYLAIVGIGPKVMEKRKPFQLNWILIPYNLAMSLLNLYIAIELLIASTKLRYSYVCQPIRNTNHEEEMRIVNAVWWYYFSKLLEFCDTFFFILRKKDQQLTFLHVYHHSTMFSLWWIGIKWVPSGSTFLPAMVNSFIHVLMYSYYGLSAIGPGIAKYLWWKKYLTILQLTDGNLRGRARLKVLEQCRCRRAAVLVATASIHFTCTWSLDFGYGESGESEERSNRSIFVAEKNKIENTKNANILEVLCVIRIPIKQGVRSCRDKHFSSRNLKKG
ncbi:unnamed protein product [Nesidiocoris tenuis]|uniref:Elongation of very long chain fatty acids protein n=1 Tax=Nesidiocoris tenuis TaxID=355587 RepID=A0A6H5HN62_9HEMI|nr:unnamed protein product [Nesidiocoris tenuis]